MKMKQKRGKPHLVCEGQCLFAMLLVSSIDFNHPISTPKQFFENASFFHYQLYSSVTTMLYSVLESKDGGDQAEEL